MSHPDALLSHVLQAHGGLERWEATAELRLRMTAGGLIYALRGQPQLFRDVDVRLETAEPWVELRPFPEQGRRGVFCPDETRIEREDGSLIESRRDPRQAFSDWRRQFWWDASDALYLGASAVWNELAVPFIFTRPGFRLRELGSWPERGERWQRLEVTFPAEVPTFCKQQTFYFGEDGLLRRHDFAVESIGFWALAARYPSEYRSFQGLMLPTCQRTYTRTPLLGTAGMPLVAWADLDYRTRLLAAEFGAT